MSSLGGSHLLTPRKYLVQERAALDKSEFYRGEVFAMAGGGMRHNLIKVNVSGTFRALLKGHRCTAYNSDLRIGILDEAYTYPDLSVFCEPMAFLPGADDTATNPTVIVEVLSPSTEAYDRGGKFAQYRKLPSLQEYLLVGQTEPVLECFTRSNEDRWVLNAALGLAGSLRLESLGVDLPLAEIYDKVVFGTAPHQQASGNRG